MTLSGDEYLEIELKVILNEHGVSLVDQDLIVANFMANTSTEEREEHSIHLKNNYSI